MKNKLVILCGITAMLLMLAAVASAGIQWDANTKTLDVSDGAGHLALRVNCDGRCRIDRVLVRGRSVLEAKTGACSAICVSNTWFTTRDGLTAPAVQVTSNSATISGIRFGPDTVRVEEIWTFTVLPERIVWRIARKYLNGGALDDTYFPGFDFTSQQTWTGALLGTGGVAWFKLFDTPVATYVVHTGPVTFWNKTYRDCLRIVPAVPEGRHVAMRFSRHPAGALSFNYYVTEQELGLRQSHYRFSRERQDVSAPFQVAAGEIAVEYTLSVLDYAKAYDRGVFQGLDGAAVREICNTIARIGAVDENILGSNGYYSGYAVLQEQWLAQLGLAIDDPSYFRAYGATLDYQREHAIGPDGRVKPRWAYGPWDAMPGTYDRFGFYEAQWGYFLDSQPDWVINVVEQFDLTGDRPWVARQKAACEQALEYMLRRDSNSNGLVEIMTKSHKEKRGGDWLDIVWASFEPATINAQMYHALVLWADVEEELGDHVRAAAYRDRAAKLKATFNRTTAEGGFWNPEKQWYVHWRDEDGSIHGDNLVLPVNFMAIGYGLCDDPSRRNAILRQVEEQMQKEKLFFWPACIYSYRQEEVHKENWPFPRYENGDMFLAWGELGTRAYVQYDPKIAVRCVKNVLDQYAKDGLAFQRYLRNSQTGTGDDILSNMASPIVGLYRNIYGIQPKWNRLYLEPHMVDELNGTKLRYWLRGRWYIIDPATGISSVAVDDVTLRAAGPFGMNVLGPTLEYFSGDRRTPSLVVTRPAGTALELEVERWNEPVRKWTVRCGNAGPRLACAVRDLRPGAAYALTVDEKVRRVVADATGAVSFEFKADVRFQTFELR